MRSVHRGLVLRWQRCSNAVPVRDLQRWRPGSMRHHLPGRPVRHSRRQLRQLPGWQSLLRRVPVRLPRRVVSRPVWPGSLQAVLRQVLRQRHRPDEWHLLGGLPRGKLLHRRDAGTDYLPVRHFLRGGCGRAGGAAAMLPRDVHRRPECSRVRPLQRLRGGVFLERQRHLRLRSVRQPRMPQWYTRRMRSREPWLLWNVQPREIQQWSRAVRHVRGRPVL